MKNKANGELFKIFLIQTHLNIELKVSIYQFMLII